MKPIVEDIKKAIRRLLSADFQHTVENVVSPFGDCGASKQIVQIIKNMENRNFFPKRFIDSGVKI